MKISRKGIDLIKEHEGLRLNAYRDPVSVLTIGYGHTSMAGEPKVYAGQKITRAEALTILHRDINRFAVGMMKFIRVSLTQGQFDALVSLSFNIGLGAFKKSTLLRKLNAGDFEGAASEFPKWRKAGGRVLPGLVKRRAMEKALFLSETDISEPYIEETSVREVEVDTGKPATQSTTIWTAIGAAMTSIITAVSGLGKDQPVLAGFVVVVAMLFALYIIRERRRLGREGMV